MNVWTAERITALTELWLDGLSASKIAAAIGHGLTRNACIGKARRLGLGLDKPAPPRAVAGQSAGFRAPAAVNAPRGARFVWTVALDALLAELVAGGSLHFAAMGAALGCDRYEAARRTAQLGLTRTSKRGKGQSAIGMMARARARPAAEPSPLCELAIAAGPVAPGCTLFDLTRSSCRWPLGDPRESGFRFCGLASSGGSYCCEHAALAYQPKIKRAVSAVSAS